MPAAPPRSAGDLPEELLPSTARPHDTLYVTDRNLIVKYTNEEWRRFARDNGGEALLRADWHGDLLASIGGAEGARWKAIYDALLSGQLAFYEEDLICPSPTERRPYHLRIEPRRDGRGEIAYLVHHDVRLDAFPEADVAATSKAYRSWVISREVRAPRLEIAGYVNPLDSVGGDLLWNRSYPDGRTDLVLADVMGHGLEAARLAIRIVLLLDALADAGASVAANVSRLNTSLAARAKAWPTDARRPLFATGLYLRLDPRQGGASICSFAHTGPIFSDVGYVGLENGLPIGLGFGTDLWPETQVSFATHGRRFLIFTDGLPDQFNLAGEPFGLTRLADAFRAAADRPLQRAIEAIDLAVREFRGPALIKDDQALFGVEYTDHTDAVTA